MVEWICRALVEAGKDGPSRSTGSDASAASGRSSSVPLEHAPMEVMVLARGYGNDERWQLSTRLARPGSGIVAGFGADRGAAARAILQRYPPADAAAAAAATRSVGGAPGSLRAAVLDDGLQHWPLERDLEVVMVNALCPFGAGPTHLIPRGTLREPFAEAMARADVVCLHHADQVPEAHLLDDLEDQVREAAAPGAGKGRETEDGQPLRALLPSSALPLIVHSAFEHTHLLVLPGSELAGAATMETVARTLKACDGEDEDEDEEEEDKNATPDDLFPELVVVRQNIAQHLAGRDVVCFCGIGAPAAFASGVRRLFAPQLLLPDDENGESEVESQDQNEWEKEDQEDKRRCGCNGLPQLRSFRVESFGDHYQYTLADLQALSSLSATSTAAASTALVTTEKDFHRLQARHSMTTLAAKLPNLVVVCGETRIMRGEGELREAVKGVRRRTPKSSTKTLYM